MTNRVEALLKMPSIKREEVRSGSKTDPLLFFSNTTADASSYISLELL